MAHKVSYHAYSRLVQYAGGRTGARLFLAAFALGFAGVLLAYPAATFSVVFGGGASVILAIRLNRAIDGYMMREARHGA